MRQLVAQDSPHLLVRPKPVVRIRPQPQLYRLPGVDVEPEEVWLLVRGELGKRAHGEAVLLHDVHDGRVRREAREHGSCPFRIWQVR